MTESSVLRKIEQFSAACTGCGACSRNCFMLDEASMHVGAIAHQVLTRQTLEKVFDLVWNCALCGLCSQKCPLNLEPALIMEQIREVLISRQENQTFMSETTSMQVDRVWNYFSLYRDTYAISYDGLKRDQYDTFFIPGCSLSCFAPSLIRKAFQWLEEQGIEVGFSDTCCSKPLSSLGLKQRADQMLEALRNKMKNEKIKQIITSCPNCHRTFKEYFAGSIEVVSIFTLLEKAGVRIETSGTTSVHDPCPDRNDKTARETVRSLLQGEAVEMEHYGRQTLCCGSGGIVSLFSPDICERRAAIRMIEQDECGADVCVTTCLACSHRLNRSGEQGRAVHLLELVFGESVNYDEVATRSRQMWEGEWGTYNLQRLNSTPSGQMDKEGQVTL
jgi:fumarate reductase (CoM/CoB) subunit B